MDIEYWVVQRSCCEYEGEHDSFELLCGDVESAFAEKGRLIETKESERVPSLGITYSYIVEARIAGELG